MELGQVTQQEYGVKSGDRCESQQEELLQVFQL